MTAIPFEELEKTVSARKNELVIKQVWGEHELDFESRVASWLHYPYHVNTLNGVGNFTRYMENGFENEYIATKAKRDIYGNAILTIKIKKSNYTEQDYEL